MCFLDRVDTLLMDKDPEDISECSLLILRSEKSQICYIQ